MKRLASTERVHPNARRLDGASALELIAALNREDIVAAKAVGAARHSIARLADAVAAAIGNGGRLLYVGAGTSGRLGALDAAECPPTFGSDPADVVAVIAGGPRALLRAVEGAEDDRKAAAAEMKRLKVSPRDVVCGISASGRAPFVRAALAAAARRGATTALVTCNPSDLSVDYPVVVRTGPELVAGSTRLKAGTATKLVLNAVTTAAFTRLGRVQGGQMVALRGTNQKLRERAVRIVTERAKVNAAAARRALAAERWSVAAALRALQKPSRHSQRPSRRS